MRAISVYTDEVAHNEPLHLQLCCLQIQLFICACLSLKVIAVIIKIRKLFFRMIFFLLNCSNMLCLLYPDTEAWNLLSYMLT